MVILKILFIIILIKYEFLYLTTLFTQVSYIYQEEDIDAKDGDNKAKSSEVKDFIESEVSILSM